MEPWQELLSHLLWLTQRLILLFWQCKGSDHSLELNNDFCLILYLIVPWIGQMLMAYLSPQDIFDGNQKEGINKTSDLTLRPHLHFCFDWDGWWMNCMAFMIENLEDGHMEQQRTQWLNRWVQRMIKKRRASRSMWKENRCNHLIITSYALWGRNSEAYSFQTEEIDFTEWPI